MPRITVDETTKQIIDEVFNMCKDCEYLESNECKEPYKTRLEVVRAALLKFGELDCSPEPEKEDRHQISFCDLTGTLKEE